MKEEKAIWYLYGKAYDLRPFMDKHPGGSAILELTMNHEADLTPMFESSHAFQNKEGLKRQLEKYLLKDEPGKPMLYTFTKGGFYDTVTKEAKKVLNQIKGTTYQSTYKGNYQYSMKCFLLISILIFLTYKSFYATQNSWTPIIAFITGYLWFGVIGFCSLHDYSHSAVFSKAISKEADEVLCRISCALILWKHEYWKMHHVVRHHSYTGDNELDPDKFWLPPYIEWIIVQLKKYLTVFPWSLKRLIIIACMSFTCRQMLGQILYYWAFWIPSGYLWGMKGPKLRFKWYEILSYAFLFYMHYQRGSLLISYMFYVGQTMNYVLGVLPDHEQTETITNGKKGTLDWGEVQVRNSGNFSNNSQWNFYFQVHGGMNYQIEHHLFPTLCHIHLPKISKVV